MDATTLACTHDGWGWQETRIHTHIVCASGNTSTHPQVSTTQSKAGLVWFISCYESTSITDKSMRCNLNLSTWNNKNNMLLFNDMKIINTICFSDQIYLQESKQFAKFYNFMTITIICNIITQICICMFRSHQSVAELLCRSSHCLEKTLTQHL